MFKESKYIMNYETMLFKPEYDSFGNLCTRVIEKNGQLVANLAPTQLMDFNLRYFGSSLRGAFDGSKMILGKLNKNPIIVQERLNILWFPSRSPLSPECTWFAVHHIDDYQAVDKKRTRVIFFNGSETIVDVSIKAFEHRIQRAYVLKYRLEKRTKLMLVQNDNIKIL
ncbi:competence protein [Lysinibacillus contaminans]|uniref:Competence protein n=1 Tax=Lysinibacillus contaminans TaxID=1293441 RepID=A0ABR5JWZ9_9BACI|nr:competence protein ComK [Lysinibacillus contaminans]KOS66690.1 competence protein [Lysinibacillus contaminans]